MGKMISVQSIAVAVAATGMTSADAGRLFRFTIKHSVFLMIVMGLISMPTPMCSPGRLLGGGPPPHLRDKFEQPAGPTARTAW